MVSAGFQILGSALGILGWIGAIIVCALPMWKVTAFIGSNIVTSQTSWEGIWMSCVVQSTGQMQCKVYDSMLALSSDLQAARALTIIAIVVGILAILLSVAGGQCTNCVEDPGAALQQLPPKRRETLRTCQVYPCKNRLYTHGLCVSGCRMCLEIFKRINYFMC
uniref:Claudin b n=1 Tax=Seriola lalandi dorsalis TaxID=1841481 RepID=A0A3B4Y8U9_SERLL